MDISRFNPSIAAFNECNWQETIYNSEKRDCLDYMALFNKKVEEAIDSKNENNKLVYSLLHLVTLPTLINKNDRPLIQYKKSISNGLPAISDFTDNQIDSLKYIFDKSTDSELNARIADILWLRHRDFKMAKSAIKNYVESAHYFSNKGEWWNSDDRLERACVIASSLKKTQCLPYVINNLKNIIDKNSSENKIPIPLIKILIEFGTSEDITQYIPLLEKVGTYSIEPMAFVYWETVAKMYTSIGKSELANKAYYQVAEHHVKTAEEAAKSANMQYLRAASFLMDAIRILKKYGFKERVEELHPKLLEYQRLSIYEMKVYTVTVEVPNEVGEEYKKQILDNVHGKPLKDALVTLSKLQEPPSIKMLRNEVTSQTGIARRIAGVVNINNEGHVVDTIPPLDDKENSESTIKNMYGRAKLHQSSSVIYTFEPVRQLIASEHMIEPSEILEIIQKSTFIPPGREMLYAKGLHAGLYGDFIEATHILIPQVENSIRELLKQNGLITSMITAKNIQNKYDLNNLLYGKYKSKLVELLGEDTVFDIQGLLVEHSGSNLRNIIAHGLVDYSDFSNWQAKYLWWSTLRLCISTIAE